MENILRSFIERFNRLTYTQKFNVITIIFVLPVIAFIPLLSDQNARIDHYGRKEFFGTLYLRPLWQLTEDLQTHELTSQRYRNGDAGLSELEAIQTSIEEGFRTLRSLHDEYRENLPLGTEADDLYTQWLELKTATLDDDAATIDRLEADLYTSIQELVAHIGDISDLILDPDLDTYYMMDTVLLKLPDNQALLLEVHQLAGSAANAQSLSVSQRAQFAILLSRIESNLIEMERNLGVALENDNSGVMSSLVSQPMQEYQANLRAFLELINTEVANPPSPQISTGPVTAVLERQFDEARQANQAFYPAASQALEKGITARVNAMILRLYFIGIIALFSVLGAFALGQTVMNAISEPLVQLADAAQRLASGDMTTRIPVQHTDELGQVSDAFNQMAEELEKDKTTITARALDLEMANQISEKRAGELQAISEISPNH